MILDSEHTGLLIKQDRLEKELNQLKESSQLAVCKIEQYFSFCERILK